MIHTLTPYPAYKDSSVPWLGEVPAHWEVKSLGSLTNARSTRNRTDLPLLSVVREKGVILRSSMKADENHNFIPDDLSNYKVVHEGDLVINKMKAWQGSLGVSAYNGIVSPAYYVFEFQLGDAKYGHMLLRSKIYVDFFGQVSDGVRIGQWDLSINGMKRIPVVIPPLSEQSAIVRYLDYMDRRIRRYVHAKQKLIKLLEEQKQAIIHRAVTRGLDPDVKLKDSGVEWLGDVPEHWDITVAKRLSDIFIPQRDKPELNDAEGIPWVTLECIGDTFTRNTPFFVTQKDAKIAGSRILPSGSVIASCVGRFGISSITTEPVIINQQIQAYIPKEKISALFLRYCVQVSKIYFELEGNSTTLAYADREAFENLPIALPPIEEQEGIIEAIDKEVKISNNLAEKAHHEIALLREYRTRMISDVVTGKLDVREVAANLPEEMEISEDGMGEGEEIEESRLEEDIEEIIGDD